MEDFEYLPKEGERMLEKKGGQKKNNTVEKKKKLKDLPEKTKMVVYSEIIKPKYF